MALAGVAAAARAILFPSPSTARSLAACAPSLLASARPYCSKTRDSLHDVKAEYENWDYHSSSHTSMSEPHYYDPRRATSMTDPHYEPTVSASTVSVAAASALPPGSGPRARFQSAYHARPIKPTSYRIPDSDPVFKSENDSKDL